MQEINNEEKIFPLLRKLDFIWSQNKELNFCDIWLKLNEGEMKYITDKELQEKLKEINID